MYTTFFAPFSKLQDEIDSFGKIFLSLLGMKLQGA
jgi:hypothetical protein